MKISKADQFSQYQQLVGFVQGKLDLGHSRTLDSSHKFGQHCINRDYLNYSLAKD